MLKSRKESLRIAFITPEFVTEKYFDGGLSNYIHRIARALVELGHEPHVITLSSIDQSDFEHEGIQVHRVQPSKLKRRLNRLSGFRLPQTSKWADFSIQAYRKLRQLHQQTPFDLAQYPNWAFCGLVSSFLLPIPYVVRLSSYQPIWTDLSGIERDLDMRLMEGLEELQLRFSRHLYAPSHTLKNLLAHKPWIEALQIIRTPFYLETTEWDESVYQQKQLDQKQYLLYFGRFEIHKGFDVLAQALPRVLEQNPDCYAVLVGKDRASALGESMKVYAQSYCETYGDRLIFSEQLPHAQLYPIIARAKLVVLPSLIDNLPNACLEAMALGRPVIGTRGASFDELITDEETGFLITPGEVDELVDKIAWAWKHPQLEAMGQAAQQKIKEFAPEVIVQQVLAYYKDVLHPNAIA